MARTFRGVQPKADGGSRKRKAAYAEKGKNKVGSNRETRQDNPFNLEGDHKSRYDSLVNRRIIPTKYIHEKFLKDVGMYDDVIWLLNRAQMLPVAQLNEFTFRSITLEFLSTVEVITNSPKWVIKFQLLGKLRTLPITEFARVFGLPERTSHTKAVIDPNWDGKSFFRSISGFTEWDPSDTPASHILNPVVKYVHRTLSTGIFARVDSHSRANKFDTYMLDAMLHEDQNADPAALLAKHIAHIPNSKAGIAIWGLITRLARKYDFIPNPRSDDKVEGHMWLDDQQCRAYGMCVS